MSNPFNPSPSARDAARKKAQNHFEAAEARTQLVKRIMASESAALDAKTAKLRALRLARDAEEAAATANTAVETPAPKAKARKKVVRA